MKPWWKCVVACVFGLLAACHALAETETGRMPRKDAVDMAAQLIEAVETKALPPVDEAVYQQAKAAFLRTVSSDAASDLDRATVYAAARLYLLTIDSGGHTMLWTSQHTASWEQSTHGSDAGRADVARVVRVGGSDVLVARPPQTTFTDEPSAHDYAVRLSAGIEVAQSAAKACALVVDLGDQKGGNAWPAIAVLGALHTIDNRARVEDRTGERAELVSSELVAMYRDKYGPLPASPLARFARNGFAVVMEPETASAGELEAMLLAGEPGVRTFGRHSYGVTTSNMALSLPDGAMVLLTVFRFAMDGEPAIRGPLQPDFPADFAETPEQSVQRAATWAAAHSPLCRPR
jgi:hypothetical protein